MEPNEVLKNIADKSALVHREASKLTLKLLTFEKWLSKMPGRTETEFIGEKISIRFSRDRDTWKLFVSGPNIGAWLPLAEISLTTKIEVVHALPDLMAVMEESQTSLIDRINEAIRGFDEFFEKLQEKPNEDKSRQHPQQ